MNGAIIDDEGVPRYFGQYLGIVFDNKDPQKIGRARVTVPGFLEPASGWALPVGGAHSSGAKGLGGYDAPPIGAAVLIGFSGGDIDVPYFSGGWHGFGEQLSAVPSTPADADKIKVYESARFLIVLNGQASAEELLIKDKTTGDLVSMKPAQLKIKATTKVTVVAPMVEAGADGIGAAPLLNGVVLASGIDPFTGVSYGLLGSASSKVTADKG